MSVVREKKEKVVVEEEYDSTKHRDMTGGELSLKWTTVKLHSIASLPDKGSVASSCSTSGGRLLSYRHGFLTELCLMVFF